MRLEDLGKFFSPSVPEFAICCTQYHPLSEYRFGLLNSTGGGMPTFVFIVRRFLGGNGISFTIMSGLELMIDLTSVISVTIPQVTVFLTILLKGILQSKFGIPILLPYKGLLMGWCVKIHSAGFSCRKVFIFWSFISFNAFFNSLLAPTKSESLSDHTEQIKPLLDMNLFKARMKELASSELVSMCTARLKKQVKKAA